MTGDQSQAILRAKVAADRFEQIGSTLQTCTALGNLGVYLGEVGQLEDAGAYLRKILVTARKLDLGHVLGGSLQALLNIFAYQGLFDQARAAGKEAVVLTQGRNDRRFQGFAKAYLSVTEHLAGDYTGAESYARDAMATWEVVAFARPFAVALLARALLAQGRLDEALPHAREAYAQLEKMGGVADGEATIRLALAECLVATGDREAAQKAVASAAEWLQSRADKLDNPAYRESFLTRIPEHRRILALARDFCA